MDATDSRVRGREYHTMHDWEGNESLTYTIVEAVAALKDVESIDLEPLHTAVETDALEQLMSSAGGSAAHDGKRRVRFRWEGYQVLVTSLGDITVRRPPVDSTE